MTGIVKALRQSYGFITAEGGAGDFFFHDEDVLGEGDIELAAGDRVSFEVVEPQPAKGPRARDVAFLAAGNSTQEVKAE